ncbi:Terpenoid synthase [Trichinella pseudospiralis]
MSFRVRFWNETFKRISADMNGEGKNADVKPEKQMCAEKQVTTTTPPSPTRQATVYCISVLRRGFSSPRDVVIISVAGMIRELFKLIIIHLLPFSLSSPLCSGFCSEKYAN